MKDPIPTSTQSNMEWLQARSNVYTTISLLFTDPHAAKFKLLFNEPLQIKFNEACERLSLASLKIDTNIEKVQDAHLRLFSHSLSKPYSLYELENHANGDVFYRTHCLADITGFYKAFGLVIGATERADHISVECEFMSHLILKELIAIEKNCGDEAIQVSHDAQVSFGADHLFKWTIPFCRKLKNCSNSFYRDVTEFTESFLETDQTILSQ